MSILYRFQGKPITTVTVYVTACELERSVRFDVAVKMAHRLTRVQLEVRGGMCRSQFVVVAAAGDDDVPRLRASTFTQVVVTPLGGTAQFDCQYEHAASTDWYRDQRRLIADDRSVHQSRLTG